MELHKYFAIFRRRWLLVILPPLIVALFNAFTYQPPPPSFNVGVNFIVGQPPTAAADLEDEERYYNWLGSEYIVNGLTDWAVSGNFKTAVSNQLAQQNVADVAPESFTVVADNVRSKLQLSIQHGDADNLAQIMDAAITVLTEQNSAALPQLGGETAVLILLDDPIVVPLPRSLRNVLDIPLQIAVGLAAGSGLALLAEYLDPTIRSRKEAEAMGFDILAEIPRKR